MEVEPNKIFGELVAIRKDLGRRVRNGIGCYWKCRCSCGKIVSIKDTDLTNNRLISCKPNGKACKTVRDEIVKVGNVYRGHTVVGNVDPDENLLRNYYKIKCNSCGRDSEKRGDTIVRGTFAKCICQLTEN